MSDAKDPPKFLEAINPHKKPNIINMKSNTIINTCNKVPTHTINTDSLFSKSVGAVTNKKNYAERAVDTFDNQDYYGHKNSCIPPPQKLSGGYNKENCIESTLYDAKPSAKNYDKDQFNIINPYKKKRSPKLSTSTSGEDVYCNFLHILQC